MWINHSHYDMMQAELMLLRDQHVKLSSEIVGLRQQNTDCCAQKARDEVTIDWMRHRVNALEKQNAILLQKAAGVSLPIPEIVPTRPGTISPTFDSMPSFEDVGDDEAVRLRLKHDDLGFLEFNEDMKRAAQ